MSDAEVETQATTLSAEKPRTSKNTGMKSPRSTPKPPISSKAKKPSPHPKYGEMVTTAINALKERGGSSRQAILKYIMNTYNVGAEPKLVNSRLKTALKAAVESGMIKQTTKGSVGVQGSFSISSEGKAAIAKAAKKAAAKAQPRRSPSKSKPKNLKPTAKPKKTSAATKPSAAKKAKSPKLKTKTKSPKSTPAKKPKEKSSPPLPKKAKSKGSKPRPKSPSKKTSKPVKAKKA